MKRFVWIILSLFTTLSLFITGCGCCRCCCGNTWTTDFGCGRCEPPVRRDFCCGTPGPVVPNTVEPVVVQEVMYMEEDEEAPDLDRQKAIYIQQLKQIRQDTLREMQGLDGNTPLVFQSYLVWQDKREAVGRQLDRLSLWEDALYNATPQEFFPTVAAAQRTIDSLAGAVRGAEQWADAMQCSYPPPYFPVNGVRIPVNPDK